MAPQPPAIQAPVPAAGSVAGDRAAEVMTHYQQVMRQFLETQQAVMLGYLGAARSGALPPVPAPRSAAPPVSQAVPSAPPAASPAPSPAPAAPAAAPAMPAAVAAAAPQAAPAAPAAPAAAPTAPDAPTTPGATDVSLGAQEIHDRLLEVVSERTGYPADMLGLDADLEGDLGVDSIKRVEIAGTFTQGLAADQRGSIDIEQLTAARTLRDVIAVLQDALGASAAPPTASAASASNGEARPFRPEPADTERIGRFVLQAACAPAITVSGGLAEEGAVVIVADETGLGEALSSAVTAGSDAVLLLPRESVPQTPEEATALAEWMREQHGTVKALVYLAPAGTSDGGLEPLLLLSQTLAGDLESAAAAGGAAVMGVTRLGGTFGLDGTATNGASAHGAVCGFLKSLAREWPTVRVKLVDLEPEPGAGAPAVLRDELHAEDGLLEVGYRGETRMTLELAPGSLEDREAHPLIDADSVVLITGGARGITAEVAVTLAERYRSTLVLVGRTPLKPEAAETAAHATVADLRSALIEARRAAGQQLTPALVEEDCRRILRGRELRENLARVEAAGSRVEYRECDVGDEAAFGALIEEIYTQHGRIDGVIHGAGVIEDRLVRDKQLNSLRRVMATKAGSAMTLARRLRPEGLRFLCLFSSVSGRFGNRGQADYAAASDVLSKLAQELDQRWDARVVSINWGPWRSRGMVSPALEAEFARRGVSLIPIETGCALLDDELTRGRAGEVEVVIGAAKSLDGAEVSAAAQRLPLLAGAEVTQPGRGEIVATRSLTVAHDRYLGDHRVDGSPVFPFAGAMETMAEIASAANPVREITGLRDIRLLKGITVADDAETPVRILARPRPDSDELDVSIAAGDGGRLHYRAVALRTGPSADVTAPAALDDLAPFPMSVADAYRDLLFHGPIFQGIHAIDGLDQRGASALLTGSDPATCVAGASGLRWLLDPVLIDSALQMQVLWARLQWDVTLLPAEIGGYDRYDVPGAGELVRHELRIRPESGAPMCHMDHWFLGTDGRLLATLTNVVGVGTRALNRLAVAQL